MGKASTKPRTPPARLKTEGHGAIRYKVQEDAFDFMVKDLAPWNPGGPEGRDLSEAEVRSLVAVVAKEAFEGRPDDPMMDNPRIPAGYTYLGQFIDHDITRDDRALHSTDEATNVRTPRLDLDSVYGGTPDRNKAVRDPDDPDRLKIGAGFGEGEDDLPRQGTHDMPFDNAVAAVPNKAEIGDSRNDENILVSQVHLAFLKHHNALVDKGLSYDEARRRTVIAYQHVVLHDFLKKVCGDAFMDEMLADPKKHKFNYPGDRALFMPKEFSVAAYRFGHTMVRPSYFLNDKLTGITQGNPIPIFAPDDAPEGQPGNLPLGSLFGGRRLPPIWTLQWDLYVDVKDSQARPQLSRKFDTLLAPGLMDLPGFRPDADENDRSLPFRNIMRGFHARLPSGQTLCEAVGIQPVVLHNPNTNLWQYVLNEATEQARGEHLGELGAHIVAETFIGLIRNSTISILRDETRDELPPAGYDFAQFLADAGMPMTAAHPLFQN